MTTRYTPLAFSFYLKTRKSFAQLIKKNSIAVFHSNPVWPGNADSSLPFKQNSDLFYLSGIDQEDTILVIFPDCIKEEHSEILFIRKTNDQIKIWEGEKLSKEEAKKLSGIQTIFFSDEFESIFNKLVISADCIYINLNEHPRQTSELYNLDRIWLQKCKEKYPLHLYERSAPLLAKLRTIKHEEELIQIEKAIEITEIAFERTLKNIKPNIYEYEIETDLIYHFKKNKASDVAFETIVASGKNACVLHYVSKNDICQSGDLVLIDFGAQYGNYNADITRCVPVNGKFTIRQAQIYQAVLDILNLSISKIQVGYTFERYTTEMIEFIDLKLISLGLYTQEALNNQDKEKPLHKKYFMHGLSHFLGLDVHDVGNATGDFMAGMILTCEPGIYIQEERIGIRLEQDILILEKGNKNLSLRIPIEIQDIENLMFINEHI